MRNGCDAKKERGIRGACAPRPAFPAVRGLNGVASACGKGRRQRESVAAQKDLEAGSAGGEQALPCPSAQRTSPPKPRLTLALQHGPNFAKTEYV